MPRKTASPAPVKKTAPAPRKPAKPVPRKWVDKIDSPAQRVLAGAIPEICGLFGVEPRDLGVKRPAAEANDPHAYVRNKMRPLAIGLIVRLGRDLGLRWHDLHNREDSGRGPGQTRIRDLHGIQRVSLANFYKQASALAGLLVDDTAVDGDGAARSLGHGVTSPEPIGEQGRFVRDRYLQILRAALVAVNGPQVAEDAAA